MKNFLIAFTVFLVWSFFGLWLYSWFQTEENTTTATSDSSKNITVNTSESTSELTLSTKDIESISTLSLEDSVSSSEFLSEAKEIKPIGLSGISSNGDIIFTYDEGISIKKNNETLNIPPTIADFVFKINDYLLSHPSKEVHINSLYSASENIQSPNLGVIRGEKLKAILTESGVPNEKIVVKPTIKEIEFDQNGMYPNSISITFKPLDLERLSELKTKTNESKTIYPIFSNTGILVNKNLQDLLKEIKIMVKNNPATRVEVIGHTDNIGNDVDNYKMGLNYSRQVRWYLVANGGIDRANIIASSSGESKPIDTNKTERGREANRRIEVVFY